MQKWAILFTFKYHTCNTFPLKTIWSPSCKVPTSQTYAVPLSCLGKCDTHACTYPWLKILSLRNTIVSNSRHTSKAFLFFRSALFSLACFCTEAKAKEKLSSPTSFLSNSMISWDRFLSRGSDNTQSNNQR